MQTRSRSRRDQDTSPTNQDSSSTSTDDPTTSTTTDTNPPSTTQQQQPPQQQQQDLPPTPSIEAISGATRVQLRAWTDAWGKEYPGSIPKARALLIGLIAAQNYRKKTPEKRGLEDTSAGVPPSKRTRLNDGSSIGKKDEEDRDLRVSKCTRVCVVYGARWGPYP